MLGLFAQTYGSQQSSDHSGNAQDATNKLFDHKFNVWALNRTDIGDTTLLKFPQAFPVRSGGLLKGPSRNLQAPRSAFQDGSPAPLRGSQMFSRNLPAPRSALQYPQETLQDSKDPVSGLPESYRLFQTPGWRHPFSSSVLKQRAAEIVERREPEEVELDSARRVAATELMRITARLEKAEARAADAESAASSATYSRARVAMADARVDSIFKAAAAEARLERAEARAAAANVEGFNSGLVQVGSPAAALVAEAEARVDEIFSAAAVEAKIERAEASLVRGSLAKATAASVPRANANFLVQTGADGSSILAALVSLFIFTLSQLLVVFALHFRRGTLTLGTEPLLDV